jgi:hypothetical protein
MLSAMILAAAVNLSSMNVVGKGNFSVLFWDGYDVTLYSGSENYDPNQEFALKLDYNMDFTGEEIAERSIKEMQAIEKISPEMADKWLAEMTKIFPDVDENSSITGVYKPNYGAVFYSDGTKIGEVKDTDFARRFFDIWLSPKTSEPKLRKKLLGESK